VIAVITVVLAMGVMSSGPNQAVAAEVDVYELAAASEERVVFSEDFGGASPRSFEQWYAGHKLFTVQDCRLTDEAAHSGDHSFRLTFYASKGGTTYFWIPVRIPRWSQLTVTMYVKTDPPGGSYQTGAGWAHPTGGYGGNVLLGAKVETESNGWERWELRVVPTLDPGDYVQGLAIFCNSEWCPRWIPATMCRAWLYSVTCPKMRLSPIT